MTIYTFSEARQKLSAILEKARIEGEVLIKRRDGSVFVIKPLSKAGSPLDVNGVDLALSKKEIVDVVREIRER